MRRCSCLLLACADCPVGANVEKSVLGALDGSRFDIDVVHLGSDKSRISEAEKLGIKSVPALALDGQVFHINFSASPSDLK